MNITAGGQFTAPIPKQAKEGYSVSISGTFSATVTTQRAKAPAGPWFDLDAQAAPAQLDGEFSTAHYVRAGVKTGEYTSGTVVVDVY